MEGKDSLGTDQSGSSTTSSLAAATRGQIKDCMLNLTKNTSLEHAIVWMDVRFRCSASPPADLDLCSAESAVRGRNYKNTTTAGSVSRTSLPSREQSKDKFAKEQHHIRRPRSCRDKIPRAPPAQAHSTGYRVRLQVAFDKRILSSGPATVSRPSEPGPCGHDYPIQPPGLTKPESLPRQPHIVHAQLYQRLRPEKNC